MDFLYKISGVVIKGENRGKILGFPTANIRLHKEIPEGIYAAALSLNGKQYQAASFVGPAKTFQQTEKKVESFIFDFDNDIYGRMITVRLYKKIRDNEKFDSVEALVNQMHKDIENVKFFFADHSSK
jgi:riboflavin kinase/FMN adenylyltransferase